MRTVIVLILLLNFAGCTDQTELQSKTQGEKKPKPVELLKISVTSQGGILIDGTLASEHEFHKQLAKLKSDRGAIWFYDDPSQSISTATMIIDFATDAGVSVTVSHEPDFSDCYSEEDLELHALANAVFKVARESKKSESPQKTIKAFQKAIEIRQQLVDRFPNVTKHQVQLAAGHNYIGMLYSENGNLPKANQAYQQARSICQKLKKKEPTGTEHLAVLARAHHNIGQLQDESNKPRKSLESHQLALAIYQQLGREDFSVVEYQEYWAISLNRIGMLYHFSLREPNKALESYQQAIAIEKRLVKENPSLVDFSTNLAGTYINIGQVASQLKEFVAAEESYTKGIESLNWVVEKTPNDPTARQYLRNAYRSRAKLMEALKRFENAVADWDKAIEYDDDGRHQKDFERQRDAAQSMVPEQG